MDNQSLSPGQMVRAQKQFFFFMFLNVISFNLLSGNIITLYALRLGAESFLIGLLASFIPLAQLLPLVGRMLVARLGTTRVMGIFWVTRYLIMIPLLFAPLFAGVGQITGALILCTISVLGFNIARGIGMVGYNPIIGGITDEKNRGTFLAKNQLITHIGAILAGVSIALLLGHESLLFLFTILFATGVVSGLIASSLIFKLPEPGETKRAVSYNFFSNFFDSLKRKGFRKFIILLLVTFFALEMIKPFLIVFLKKVYNQGDNTVIFFAVIGSIGSIIMALLSGFLIDRIGAKPLIFLFAGIITITLIPLTVIPHIESTIVLWLYAGGIFFFFNMGYFGIFNSANTYFFGIIKPEERLNLGIVYFLTTGISGTVGSFVGGGVLQWLQKISSLSIGEVFRIYFGLLIGVCIIILYLTMKLERIGSYSIRNLLNIFLSPRDLQSISLLNRLSKSKNLAEEKRVIHALGEKASGISTEDLLQKLSSPRFTIRAEALRALDNIAPDNEVEKALISEVKNHKYTTAYLAANTLGKKGIKGGIKVLRQALRTRDYFLSGMSMVSLARLDDTESIPVIEDIIATTDNPRLIIYGASAFEIFKNPGSIPVLIRKLEKKTSPFVRDEIILAISGIMGIDGFFYPLFTGFLEKGRHGTSGLKDFLNENQVQLSEAQIDIEGIHAFLENMNKDRSLFAATARQLLEDISITLDGRNVSQDLIRATMNENVIKLDRFCFLLAAVIVWFSFKPVKE